LLGVVGVVGLDEQVAADLELLEGRRGTPATVRQGQPGEFAQPLGTGAEQFMEASISVHVDSIEGPKVSATRISCGGGASSRICNGV